MKKIHIAVSMLMMSALLFFIAACNNDCIKGSGKPATENRKLKAFSKIEISGAYKVALVQDSSYAITIKADDNIMALIKTDVSGDKLKISTGNKSICANNPITITLGLRDLRELKVSGAVEVTSGGKINTGDLDLDLSGASKINIDLKANNINTGASGVNEITLRGQAASHTVNFSGSGKLHAFDFVVAKYGIETTGESDCEINVLSDLDVHTTGAATIKYKGSPAQINKSETGSLTLTKVE